ncbi:hypothetical protein [Halocalculus aciditolerans]|uniref:Uncharacterized protein n=1 Tax=Halocalculus aciditolerans TaxID=1383812 RepID=A0A830F265_9EURY|nr:hypothetical protein [Halocalculus aciditolerans]GGL55240.1 hypothetical protein GCM10009039_11690 [Halocalculus aciditolerans]
MAAAGDNVGLHVGDHVRDKEDDDSGRLLVVGISAKRAGEHRVGTTSKTVAEFNEDYPSDDHVIEVQYVQRTDMDVSDGTRYSFPRSRLEVVERIHDIEGDEEASA